MHINSTNGTAQNAIGYSLNDKGNFVGDFNASKVTCDNSMGSKIKEGRNTPNDISNHTFSQYSPKMEETSFIEKASNATVSRYSSSQGGDLSFEKAPKAKSLKKCAVKALLSAARIMFVTLVSAGYLTFFTGWAYVCVFCPLLLIPTALILILAISGMAGHIYDQKSNNNESQKPEELDLLSVS